ncbi:MAG TPA: hypothetical protein VGL02_18930 [Streptomyces sp.]
MDQQLALFPDSAVTGSGQPAPWPVAAAETETVPDGVDPNQITFDEAEEEAA